jgi:alanyl aminopeptidase
VMHSLLDQTGVPVVHAELRCDTQPPRVMLRQEPAKWKLPVCVRATDSSVQCVLMETGTAEIPLTGAKHCPAWVLTNAGATGYFRSELSAGQFASLIHNGFEHLTAAERLTTTLDMAASVYNGRLPASEALKLLPSLAQDPEPQVVVAAVNLVNALGAIVPSAQREKYNQYVRSSFGSRVEKPEDLESLRRTQEKSVVDFLEKLPAKQ